MKTPMCKNLLFAATMTGAALMQVGCLSSSSDGSSVTAPPTEKPPVATPGQPGVPQNPNGPLGPSEPAVPIGSVESVNIHFVRNVDGRFQACAAVDATVLQHNRDGRLVGALEVMLDGSVDVTALEKTDYFSIVNETESSVAVFSAEVALLGQGQNFNISAYSGRSGECFGGDNSSSQPQPSFQVEVANPERFTEIDVGPGGAIAFSENIDSGNFTAAKKSLQVLDDPYDILVTGYILSDDGMHESISKYELISGRSQQPDVTIRSNPMNDPVVIPLTMTTPLGSFDAIKTELYSQKDDWKYSLEFNRVMPNSFGGLSTINEVRTIDDASRDLIVSRTITTLDLRKVIETRERFANDVSSITMPDKDWGLLSNVILSAEGINYFFGGDGSEVVVAKGIRLYEPGENAPFGAKAVQQAVFTASATGYLVMPDLREDWTPAEPFQNYIVEVVTSDSAIHIYDHMALIVMEVYNNIISSSVLDEEVIRDMESIPLGLRLTEPYTKYRVKSKPF